MRKLTLLASALLVCALSSHAQDEKSFKFTDVKTNPSTSPKDQSRSGTCWSFSGIGLLENDILKAGKGEVDLSEMWIVRNAYFERAVRYARMHGSASIAAGGSTGDVFSMIKKYGIVPEEAYRGLNYGMDHHSHAELDAAIKAYMNVVISNPNKSLSTAWKEGLNGILDAYFGAKPEKFTYKGKEYTPMSFAKELGLDMNDYVVITSFTHHPFYSQFVIEVPDNWNADLCYNVTMEDMETIMDNAINNGYSINWASDVSEKGFLYNKGVAVIPAVNAEEMDNSEKAKWTALTPEEMKKMSVNVEGPTPEKKITQEMRQTAFDNYETTDDHGMVIMGIANDQKGNKYYKVKNSWAQTNTYKGFFYASQPFVLYKTTSFAVNKNAIPKQIAKKLGL